MIPNRRKNFFINKPLQTRFMLAVIVPLLLINLVAFIGLYFGIWAKVLDSFSDEQTRNDMLTASRIVEYDQAHHPEIQAGISSLTFLKQTEKLSQRQREVFGRILSETNRSLFWKFSLLLVLIAFGTIFISHKIAGPLYRLSDASREIEKGNFRARVALRKMDEGHSVAQEFNHAMESTDRLLSNLKSIANESDAPQALARIKEKLATLQTGADV